MRGNQVLPGLRAGAASVSREIEENRMYGLDEYEVLHQCPEEIRQEVAVARLEKVARANCETRSYMARDLSWELARYLDTQTHSASASAIPSSASGNGERWAAEE
jgi:hypothetical protein